MKNPTVISLVFITAILILVIASQHWPANARETKESLVASEVVLIHCERSGSNIKVINADSSTTTQVIPVNSSCSGAVDKLLTAGFTIHTAAYDNSSAFNYTFIK